MGPLLIIDANYLAYRAHFSTGKLTMGGKPTGVTFGFMRDIVNLQEQFATWRMAFCFDLGRGLREQVDITYKAARRNKTRTAEEQKEYQDIQDQINDLRVTSLPALGFKNIFYHEGYEADDVIASVICAAPKFQPIVIVSADRDLWQLLYPGISCYNPSSKHVMTGIDLIKQYGVAPVRWPMVKAIAGCPTDGVVGVRGVGEATAAKYITGRLNADSATAKRVLASWPQVRANLRLVTLPFPGVRKFTIVDDQVDQKVWREVTERLGMQTLIERVPLNRRPQRA